MKGNQGTMYEDVKEYFKEKKFLKEIQEVMETKTLEKDGIEKEEDRYFISSLREDIELISRAVRGHWSIESMH
ncbi:Uncharacterised protein [Tyzzerella nexilis]|uniref:Uncharacterized protein n=1 Tax=[Clostridium] nexile TaxID=29361 RepID=A0A6N2VQG4_9FIRM